MSADDQHVSIPDDIVNKFEKYENALKGKPKIFWFQFCRSKWQKCNYGRGNKRLNCQTACA